MTDANLSLATLLNKGRLTRTRHTHNRDIDIFNSDDTVRGIHSDSNGSQQFPSL